MIIKNNPTSRTLRISILERTAPWCPVDFLLTLVMLGLLTSCGGQSGTDDPLAILAFNGTAATGAPIGNATVGIRCKSNSTIMSTSTNTDSDGVYTASISNAAYPCLLQVTDAKGNKLHSFVNSDGLAHITPLTDTTLAVALGQEDLGSVFASFDTDQMVVLQNAIKADKPAQAWANLKDKLTSAGVDVSAITASPFASALKADAANKGKGHDKALDETAAKGLNAEHLYRMAAGKTVPPTAATGLLNDTGIDWCSENITTPGTWVSNAVCSVVSWVGNLWGQQQDAFFGRDAQAKMGSLIKVGGGKAGFDFTKIGSDGKPLAKQDGIWSDSGGEKEGTIWDCVRDNVTGLVWEIKRNDVSHLRHMEHRYAWYFSDTRSNGGAEGSQTPTGYFSESNDFRLVKYTTPTCTGVGDVNKCNTQSYVVAVNEAGLCGKNDWRMPNVDELRNWAHTGLGLPAVDGNYFPNTSNYFYWSSTPSAEYGEYAWGVTFSNGGAYINIKKYAERVRLVRSGP